MIICKGAAFVIQRSFAGGVRIRSQATAHLRNWRLFRLTNWKQSSPEASKKREFNVNRLFATASPPELAWRRVPVSESYLSDTKLRHSGISAR